MALRSGYWKKEYKVRSNYYMLVIAKMCLLEEIGILRSALWKLDRSAVLMTYVIVYLYVSGLKSKDC